MNYAKIYDALITRAKSRVLLGYRERHHIVPRCMGGTDDKENLVDLTAEEHFVAHQLLVKIYPGVSGLVFAVQMMTVDRTGNRCNNKMYGWLKRLVFEAQLGQKHSLETRAKLSLAAKRRAQTEEGKAHLKKAHIRSLSAESSRKKSKVQTAINNTPEMRAKRSQLQRNHINTEAGRAHMQQMIELARSSEARRKNSEAKRGQFVSLETREKLSKAGQGRVHSPETKKKMSEARQRTVVQKKIGQLMDCLL
jgi:hypothetical protein